MPIKAIDFRSCACGWPAKDSIHHDPSHPRYHGEPLSEAPLRAYFGDTDPDYRYTYEIPAGWGECLRCQKAVKPPLRFRVFTFNRYTEDTCEDGPWLALLKSDGSTVEEPTRLEGGQWHIVGPECAKRIPRGYLRTDPEPQAE